MRVCCGPVGSPRKMPTAPARFSGRIRYHVGELRPHFSSSNPTTLFIDLTIHLASILFGILSFATLRVDKEEKEITIVDAFVIMLRYVSALRRIRSHEQGVGR